MRVMANSRLAGGATLEQLTRFFDQNGFSSAVWDLVRHRVVTHYWLKVGDVPGVVLFMEVDSPETASEIVTGLPAVQQGLLTFEADQLGMSL
ncbi:MAG TPA: hypothetical protein VIT65_18800 [Microlunatus sp.]